MPGSQAERTIDVHAFLDERPFGGRHLAILLATMLLLFIDGFDVFMLGRIAPIIARAYGEPVVAMTKVFVAQQIGLAIGAFCTSLAADRYGRKFMMVIAASMFGLLTLSALLTTTLAQLAFTRFLDGIFLGGIVLTSSALIVEIAPKKWRATMMSCLYVGYGLGNTSGALIAIPVAHYGWRLGFLVGGLLPFVVGAIFIAVVPESPRFLMRKRPDDPRLPGILKSFDRTLDLTGTRLIEPQGTTPSKRGGPALLFVDGRWRMTLLLWSTAFISMGTIALNAAWQTSYFTQLGGFDITAFTKLSMAMFVGNFIGNLSLGPLTDRFGATRMIQIVSFGLVLALCTVGRVPFGSPAFIGALLLQGFCMSGGQSSINALVAQSYPTAVRATGFGWTGTIGRLSGVLSPLMGSYALVNKLPLATALTMMALPSLLIIATMQGLAVVRRQLGVDRNMG